MLTYERAKSLFILDYDTGELYFRISSRGRRDISKPVGSVNKAGYLRVTVNYTSYYVHRIVWLLVHGEWPVDQIDHRNRIKSDNRPTNLRDVTQSEQNYNKGLQSNNTTGFKGLTWLEDGQTWMVCKGNKYIGRFKNTEDAVNAYQLAHS